MGSVLGNYQNYSLKTQSNMDSKSAVFDSLAKLGEHNTTILDKICALLVALGPLLQNYVGPAYNAGITALILVFVWVSVRLANHLQYKKISYRRFMAVLPHICLFIYKIVAHGTTFVEFMQNMILITVYLAAAAGCINIRYVVKYAAFIAIIGSCGIILQTLCYYLLGFHITMVPTALFTNHAQQWIGAVTTGLIGITGRKGSMYRPSAFFMEPSHVFIYCFPILFLFLFSNELSKKKLKIAILITTGCVLSTSGLGIFVAVGAWFLYFATKSNNNRFSMKNIFKPNNVVILSVVAVAIVILYFNIPVLNQAVNRIFVPNKYGITAVSGRTSDGIELVGSMRGSEWIFGAAESLGEYTFNLSSFVSITYAYGIIGFVCYYWFYIHNTFFLKEKFFWINVLLVVISFFSSHPHSTLTGLYYMLILLEGYDERRRNIK